MSGKKRELQTRRGKRAQGLSITALVLIVIGIVILVLLILGFTIGWDKLLKKFGIFASTTLADVAQRCNIDAQSRNAVSYCTKFDKIDDPSGEDHYINCLYPDVLNSLSNTLDANAVCPEGYKTANGAAASYCNKTLASQLPAKKIVKINGQYYGIKEETIDDTKKRYCTKGMATRDDAQQALNN